MRRLVDKNLWSPVLFWIEYKLFVCCASHSLFNGKIIVSPKFSPPNLHVYFRVYLEYEAIYFFSPADGTGICTNHLRD